MKKDSLVGTEWYKYMKDFINPYGQDQDKIIFFRNEGLDHLNQ